MLSIGKDQHSAAAGGNLTGEMTMHNVHSAAIGFQSFNLLICSKKENLIAACCLWMYSFSANLSPTCLSACLSVPANAEAGY